MNIAEILRAAAGHVRNGWMQGDLMDGAGNVCAVGAICRAAGTLTERNLYDRNEWMARGVAARVLKLSAKKPMHDPLPDWNDAEGQTAENVAVGLEYAALVWEQEQNPAKHVDPEAVCVTT